MTKKQNVNEPKNGEDQKIVTVDNFIPGSTPDVTVITSTYEDAESWGAVPVSNEELEENIGLNVNNNEG